MQILIQARSTSTRLPDKGMQLLGDKPIIRHVIDTCRQASKNVCVIIPFGDELKKYLYNNFINFIEGPEDDVLGRYYYAAKALTCWKPGMFDQVCRITADCPLIPISQLSYMLHVATKKKYDFYTNAPCVDGHDIEIISMTALDWANKTAKQPHDREHVTTLMKSEWAWTKMKQMGYRLDKHQEPVLTEWYPKLSIDTPEDLTRIRGIYEKLAR